VFTTASIDGGAGDDRITFSAIVNSRTTVNGGIGADTLYFHTTVSNAVVSSGTGADSVVFNDLVTATTIAGGGLGQSQTIAFSSTADVATFTGNFGTGNISFGTGADTITFTDGIAGTTLTGLGDSGDRVSLLGATTVVFGTDGIGTGAMLSFGASGDMATFMGAISAASIYGNGGNDTLVFNNVAVNGASISGGADIDVFNGGITVGSSGVCFWGGLGADSFNFGGGISNASGTAYFWNQNVGTDYINLGAANNVRDKLGFGVTAGNSGLLISYGDVSNAFDAATSSLFSIAGSTGVASVVFSGNTGIFLQYSGGSSITFVGATGITADFGALFGNGNGAGATANFGVFQTFPTFS